MKPELLIQNFDTVGKNNGGIKKTRAVLDKAKAWKKQRIVVILPASDTMSTKIALTHWNLIFPPNNGVVRMVAIGMEVGEAYSTAIEQILKHPELSKWEYILTIEHDNAPQPDGVLKLLQSMEDHPELDCIGGLYFVKGHGAPAQIWGDPKDPVLNFRPQLPDPSGGLVECNGTGMGFNLWRMKMFKDKKLRKPWFKTDNGSTQDLYAWNDFRKHGYRCAIDCSVKVGHFSPDTGIMW